MKTVNLDHLVINQLYLVSGVLGLPNATVEASDFTKYDLLRFVRFNNIRNKNQVAKHLPGVLEAVLQRSMSQEVELSSVEFEKREREERVVIAGRPN